MRSLIIAVLLIHAVFLFPFLKPGIPLSHDGDGHLARIAAFYTAFKDGQFPPRWAADLNFRFGTPVFIFNYNLPYFAASLLHALGLNLADSFKVILSISFILSPLGFFLWLSRLFRKTASFIGAMLFGLSPYHFLNVFVRGAFGEVVGLAIVPFIFLQIEKIIANKKVLDVLLAGILYGLLILSHNGTTIIFSPIFFLYFLLRMKNKFQLIQMSAFFFIGFLLSSYFWLPAILESKYVGGISALSDMYKEHFPPFLHLIYSKWGFGSNVNAQDGQSPQVGVILFIFVIIAVTNFLRHRNKFVGFWLLIFFVAVFFTISLSDMIWTNLTLLKILEFPWRFTSLSSFAGAVIGVYIIHLYNSKKLTYCITVILLLSSFFYTKTNTQIERNDKYYYSFTGSTVYRSATSTIWTGEDPYRIPRSKIKIISGNGKIDNLLIKSNLHSFTVNADSSVTILDNTFYFPGWKAEINEKKVPIEFQDINHRGLITFSVPKGSFRVEVKFNESPIRFFANIVSFITIILLGLSIILRKKLPAVL